MTIRETGVDSRYERFLNQAMVDRELTRLAGQITNLRKGNVETAELISGENLLPPVNPVERYLETKKLNTERNKHSDYSSYRRDTKRSFRFAAVFNTSD